MVTSPGTAVAEARNILSTVVDPEIPVLTIEDLGVLREVAARGDTIVVTITPTYSGCPAMDHIKARIVEALGAGGFADVEVETRLSPAWSTDWMSDGGKKKLEGYGIAPPRPTEVALHLPIRCPQCGSNDTESISEFGSTACKSLLRCRSCLEPFDHFKEL